MLISSLIIDFLEYMEIEKGNSPLSAQNYDRYLRRFSGFAKVNGIIDIKDINSELLRKYRLWLGRQNLSKSTQNYYLIALRTFFKYLGSRNLPAISPDKIELAKTGERQISFLDEAELEHLLSMPDLTAIQGVRDRAIMELFFSTGLRISELCNLKIEDINLDKSEFSVVGKGKKVRVVFMDQEAKNAIHNYLIQRNDKNEYLFISYGHSDNPAVISDNPITPRSVQRMIHKYAKIAGLTKKVTPHVLRHSFATDLLMNGADIRSVQQLLGHSSITTTQIYTHVTDQHLADVHQAFHGKRRIAAEENNEKIDGDDVPSPQTDLD